MGVKKKKKREDYFLGYKKWSRKSKIAWRRFWERPTDEERIDAVMGWNEDPSGKNIPIEKRQVCSNISKP